jgi:hypothetical protein
MKKEFLIQQDPKQLFDQAARNQAAKRLKDLDNPYKQGSGNPTQKSKDEFRSNLEKQVWQQKEEEINQLSQKLKTLSKAYKSEKVGTVSDTYNYRDAEHNRLKQLEKQKLKSELKQVESKIEFNEGYIKLTKKEIQGIEYNLDYIGKRNDLFLFISLILGVFIIAGMTLTPKSKSNG